jgi:hypothetical protein
MVYEIYEMENTIIAFKTISGISGAIKLMISVPTWPFSIMLHLGACVNLD